MGTYATPSLNNRAMALVVDEMTNVYSGVYVFSRLGFISQIPAKMALMADGYVGKIPMSWIGSALNLGEH